MPRRPDLNRAAWRRLRAHVLARARHRCAQCGAVATVAHHRHPVEKGGAPYDPANVVALCRNCHEETHGRRRKRSPERAAWDARRKLP